MSHESNKFNIVERSAVKPIWDGTPEGVKKLKVAFKIIKEMHPLHNKVSFW